MNALTKAAINQVEARNKYTTLVNYAIAVSAGLILGVMFGMGV